MTISFISLVSPQYGYVLLCIAALAFQCLLIGFFGPGRMRRQVFSERFMKENFTEIHTQELREEIKADGYPDTGNGRYAQLLTYAEWYNFNNAQRAHLNFVEQIATCLALIAIGGLYYPVVQASFGLAMFLGRIFYTIGYMNSGPKGRLIGAITWDIGLVASMVLACISSIKLILQKKP